MTGAVFQFRSRVRCCISWPDELLIRHILLQLGTGFSDEELEEHHQSLQVGPVTALWLSPHSLCRALAAWDPTTSRSQICQLLPGSAVEGAACHSTAHLWPLGSCSCPS